MKSGLVILPHLLCNLISPLLSRKGKVLGINIVVIGIEGLLFDALHLNVIISSSISNPNKVVDCNASIHDSKKIMN